ncbi:MAG: exo-alpha-sialidase [Chitinispirillia bacterium]|jgi:predicted neuraminidase
MHCTLNLTTIVFLLSSFVFIQTGHSQEFSFSGKVVDFSGQPIPDATVTLKKAGKSTKTASDGTFTLAGKPTAINDVLSPASKPNFAFLRNGYLEVRISKRAPVSITVFSIGGKTLFHKKAIFNTGIHALSIPVNSHGVYLIRVRSEGQEATFKTSPIEGKNLGSKIVVNDNSTKTFARQDPKSIFNDTMSVTKEKFLDYNTKIFKKTEQSGMVIRMASEDHPLFKRTKMYTKASFPSCHCASIEELQDGTLLSVFFGGSGEGKTDVEIRLCRKEPGKEWTAPISVAVGTQDGKRGPTRNPVVFETFDGKVILFYRIFKIHGYWPLYGWMKTSMDGGKTWSEPRRIAEDCIGPEKNKPVQLENGTILSPTANRNDKNNKDNNLNGHTARIEISTDNGETWKAMPTIETGNFLSIQPTILSYPDGRLQILCRAYGGKLPTSWSNDSGKTWSKLEQSILPCNWSGIDGVTLRDGRQFLVYNHVPTKHGSKGSRSRLNLAVSKDGKAWSAGLFLGNGNYHYPSIIQSRDGLVHIVFTWARKVIGYIVVNPYKITDDNTVPMPNGNWPSSGPLSKEPNQG